MKNNNANDLILESHLMRLPTIRGPVYSVHELKRGYHGPHGKREYENTTLSYVKLADMRTLQEVRDAGHEYEGYVSIGGRRYSAFTSGGRNPDGGDGMIIARVNVTQTKKA